MGARSEFTTTYANPDGASFRLVQSAVPVRVKSADGAWVKPDATLVTRPDGTVGPKATIVGLSFSGGGAGSDLVEIEQDGRTLALGWGKPLPKPTLEGDSATYPEVLPGVDLRMTATVGGFREVLVVKTPEAAASPELKEVKFALKANGLEVSGSKENGLTAWNSDGQTVFSAPPAQMWDSSGPESSPVQATAKSASTVMNTVAAVTTDEPSPGAGEGEGEPSPFDGPGLGDQTATLGLNVDATSLTVVPDAKLMAQKNPSAFPLYIDPKVNADEDVERLLLRNDGHEDYDWENAEDQLGQGVGQCGYWHGYKCGTGSGYLQRLYFQFTPDNLRGKRVLDATFTITEAWAFQCEPRNVWLVRTASAFTKSTTWGNKPAYLDLMGDRAVSAGRGSACDPNSPAAPIKFNDNPDEPDENLTPTVQAWATGNTKLTLELRAENEGDTSFWQRFRNDAALSVDFIGNPAAPTGQSVDGTPCEKDLAEATTISHEKPELRATTEVYPGGELEARLRVAFLIERQDGASWVKVNSGPFIDSPNNNYYGANTQVRAEPELMPTLQDGKTYRVLTWTRSFAANAATAGSNYVTCYFKLDASAPKEPRISSVDPYSECDSSSCTAKGMPGEPGKFTFRPAVGEDSKVVGYEYRVTGDTKWLPASAAAGSSVSVKVAPRYPGLNVLYVRGLDDVAGGRKGLTAQFRFAVAEDPAPVAHWNFYDMSGDDAKDTATNDVSPDPADLRNGATRPSDGRRGWLPKIEHEDTALKLDGVDDYAATSGSVINTQKPFTIAGWVRPDRVDTDFSMAGIAGEYMSAVTISHKAGGTWSVTLPTTDDSSASTTKYVVNATAKTVPKVWTHVAVEYDNNADNDPDKETKRLRLYVNGNFQGGLDLPSSFTPVAAKGPLTIGRNKHRGAWVNDFPGLIDEVTVWQSALSPDSLKADVQMHDMTTGRNLVELSARWNPDTASGSVLTDTSGYNRDLNLSSGATVAGGKLVLNGTSGDGWAAGPLVDEMGSFTATADVELDKAKLAAKEDGYVAQVLGQRASSGAAWGLWFKMDKKIPGGHNPDGEEVHSIVGKWYFGRLTSSGEKYWVESEVADLKTSTQITVVHNAQDNQLTLYLDGRPVSQKENYYAPASDGTTFAVGKGLLENGTWGNYLPGKINDVRLWSGAMKNTTQVMDFT
ncbi:LamG domain-containing protein [Streptomyces sp. NBC_01244]|uniref:LamG domain-containing protein n=1 Tax=Streptomyces sp. NBC_01244 TaxID=2903797 RepID=UPI002E12C084|nr:LamG domain protein jellyroll fold domain protein [Streptomyces sp. NBC_01244]